MSRGGSNIKMTKQRAQQPAHKVVSSRAIMKPKKKELKKSVNQDSRLRSFSRPQSVAAAYSSQMSTRMPSVKRLNDRVRITHQELIGSITGTVTFTQSQGFALNPGLPASFPWLSSQAQGWERYRFHSLRFCYYTRTGSNTPGSMMMVPDYDAADVAPVSEQIASAYKDVVEDAPWKNICCDLPQASLNALGPTKFIRIGALSANEDIKTYDSGNLFVFTTDGAAVSWGSYGLSMTWS
jgi:hypothetical protein